MPRPWFISPAAPAKKSNPTAVLILAIGLFGGIALGAALGFLREIMDRVFRTSEQIEATLQVPCLSLDPLLRNTAKKIHPPPAATQFNKEFEITLFAGPGMYWTAAGRPAVSEENPAF